mgnify:FL=1
MSSESNVGGANAHNDGQEAVVSEEYGTDNHNSMVEYRVLNSGFDVPDNHENVIANRYRGPADDIAYEQLAGQGEIQIIEPNQSVELNGPPEPVVTDSGETRVCIPEQGDPSDID